MVRKSWFRLSIALLIFSAAGIVVAAQGPATPPDAAPQAMLGTSFTYQGRLTDGGQPASGTYDFEFSLYDDPSAGGQVGEAVVVHDKQVTDGLFTARIDFGGRAFDGSPRWLQVRVRPGNSKGPYTTLIPRQPVTPAPYALALPGLRTEPDDRSPNVIGGNPANDVAPGVEGATISGGGQPFAYNSVTGSYGTVGGGISNTAALHAVVGGGMGNRAPGNHGVVGGGLSNEAASNPGFTTVGGGLANEATGGWSTVAGGQYNAAAGTSASVGGGVANAASEDYTFIGGGESNTAVATYAAVGGGSDNSAYGLASTIAGGQNNTAYGIAASIGGGQDNATDDVAATVAGGQTNTAGGYAATVGGGYLNLAAADYATIAGGGWSMPGDFSTNNRVTDDYGTVGGGGDNRVGDANADRRTAMFATVGGGESNTASSPHATVAGGDRNTAAGTSATIGGGQSNIASFDYTTVGGGYFNGANGPFTTVSGGYANVVTGTYSVIPGGFLNRATGNHSFAAGNRASVTHRGAFAWADATGCDPNLGVCNVDFNSAADNEFAARATGGVRFVTAVDGSGDPAAGAHLAAGSGSWSSLSDRNAKTALVPVDGADVLAKVANLPIMTWRYNSQAASVRHIGPTAQDFHTAFGVGEDAHHISMVDADGVALAAIQGLYAVVGELEARTAALEAENAVQQQRIAALESQLTGQAGAGTGSARSQVWPEWLMLGGLVLAGSVAGRRWIEGGLV